MLQSNQKAAAVEAAYGEHSFNGFGGSVESDDDMHL
jgi:hypothetical protein